MSNYDSYRGVIGHEAINEIIVYRLASILGINCLDYILIDGKILNAYLTVSKDYKKANETTLRFDAFYDMNKLSVSETPLMLAKRFGYENEFNQMLLLDFLTIQCDRHGANIEILKSKQGYRLAPLFDNGISFLAPMQNDYTAYKNFKAMQDLEVNNFVGSKSLFYNLDLISKPVEVNSLTAKSKEYIFYDLMECMPQDFLTKSRK